MLKGIEKVRGKWQVNVELYSKRFVVASTSDLLRAADIHDFAVLQNKGPGAEVNFRRTRAQAMASLFEDSLVGVIKIL